MLHNLLAIYYTEKGPEQRMGKLSGKHQEGHQDEKIKADDIDLIRRLTPMDDEFMRCLFKGDLSLTELVLRIITGIKDIKLTAMETQKDIKRLAGARSICLDVYGEDSSGRKYDLEVQKNREGAVPERARYHSSAMDMENLSSGEPFQKLPETYTIFIIGTDYFKTGTGSCPIERINMSTNGLFHDGEHIIYVNGQYEGEDELGKLMHDFRCCDPKDMLIPAMKEKASYYKENQEGVTHMSQILDEMREKAREEGRVEGRAEGREEGRVEGRAEGRAEERIKNIHKLMQMLHLTAEQAMDIFQVPEEERARYLRG